MDLKGIHHLTAVSGDIVGNRRFYTETVGMRLVKRSVNQDDVSAYHLFYADARGTPGTDLTFFDWPVPPERRGTRSIVQTSLRVAGEVALGWWQDRLRSSGVKTGEVAPRNDRLTLDFEDPEGQRLALVDDGGADGGEAWDGSPVPPEYQVRGLGPIVLSVPNLGPTDTYLQQVMGMRMIGEYEFAPVPGSTAHVYEMGDGGPGAELHVAAHPSLPTAHPGAGGVHHVAFITPDDEYDEWAAYLNRSGIPNSGKVDRYWFRSLYFREPNGILFEIATEGPGFAVDEDEATLGEKVVLPPFLEPQREKILAGLKPLD